MVALTMTLPADVARCPGYWADGELRERVRSICQSIPTRSISGVRLDIDANRQP